jgi:outer membrane protein assembly factor BamB
MTINWREGQMRLFGSRQRLLAAIIGGVLSAALGAAPTIYPTGTTIYDPVRAWNGYTVFITPRDDGAILVDMNGSTVKQWRGFDGAAGGPARALPGGYVISGGPTRAPHQESNALIQLDWQGNVVWQFGRTEHVENADGESIWSARQHHDWQIEGMPAGYFSPGAQPDLDGGKMLLLVHANHVVPAISDRMLEDDRLIEISRDGEILWDWTASDHVDGLGFSAEAREIIRAAPNFNRARGSVDWLHINSATYVGPNRWYDRGDDRFHPEHVVISSRQANIIAIVARDGDIVWRMGPDYRNSTELAEIGQVIGQHHPHIIPRGLPGAGNLLVFDNGGAGGYGFTNPNAVDGVNAVGRGNSRVLEIDPVTLEKRWEYRIPGTESFRFFSHYISSTQRLPNGNTLITEGADGRLFEVTPDGEIVWEYVSSYFAADNPISNRVYRAYRLPYDWIPQLEPPAERAVVPPPLGEFRIEAQ